MEMGPRVKYYKEAAWDKKKWVNAQYSNSVTYVEYLKMIRWGRNM
jgi:uncharacterized protein YraI